MLYLSGNCSIPEELVLAALENKYFPLNSQVFKMKPLLFELLLAYSFVVKFGYMYCIEFYIYTLFIYYTFNNFWL